MLKFIIVGYSRTGSSLLQFALREHPEIEMYGELFSFKEEVRKNTPVGNSSYLDGTDAALFLKDTVFCERDRQKQKSVGFKILYYQAREDNEARKAWKYLLSQKDIHVIHAIRQNLLECLISREVAMQTEQWLLEKSSKTKFVEIAPFRIEVERCKCFFESVFAWREWATRSFQDHPFMTVEYEADICLAYQETMNRIHDFLSVSPYHAPMPLQKQAQKKPRDQVCNYDELKEYFQYTLFSEFFE
ncbi:MAG: sulfotransferase [Nostoc sp.]